MDCKLGKALVLACAAAALPGTAMAATNFAFSYVYDGATAVLQGPQTPQDTEMEPGDSFTATVTATPGNAWTTLSPITNAFFLLSFGTQEEAVRTGTSTLQLLLGGAEVHSDVASGIGFFYVDVGQRGNSIPEGVVFDTFRLTFLLEDSEGGELVFDDDGVLEDIITDGSIAPTVLTSNRPLFEATRTFYNDARFAFAPQQGPAVIPLPAAAPLLLGALAVLGGAGLLRRRRVQG